MWETLTRVPVALILSEGEGECKQGDHTRDIPSGRRKHNAWLAIFRLSYNYFYLKPGEVYMYDETKPFIHPKSNLAATHALMMIGIGKKQSKWNEKTKLPVFRRHMVMQNSEGKRFGMDGIGRISKNSVRGLYRIQV
uniref:Uncharacterized protein n=1 Tax=Oryza punctata TaxID=4537 RepID=A0A0E0MHP3_ORYPU